MKLQHSTCQQICKTDHWPQDCKRSVFIPIPKKGNAQIFIPSHNCTHLTHWQSNAQNSPSKASTDVLAGFRKGRGTRDQIANICWIIEKAREFQKNISFCFISYAKAFECVDHNKLWKIPQEMGIPDHLTSLLRHLYAGQEATVRTRHGTGLLPNWERSLSRQYIVTLLI